MKLTNVARASLNDELLRDYKSFLTQRGLRVWHKDSPEALAMRDRLKHDLAPNLPPATPGKVRRAGQAFFCCSGYPDCRETRQISDEANRPFIKRRG